MRPIASLIAPMVRLLLFACLAVQGLSAVAQAPQAPSQSLFPGYSATPASSAFPGFAAVPIGTTPLSTPPSVISLDHLEQGQMSNADYEVVSNLSAELSKAAALASFDISSPEWHFQQIVCPAFPDYVLLSFTHGPDANGSSHFSAMLPRNSAQVRIVSTYAHGLLPFEASWSKPATYEVFNGMLRQERGTVPLSHARNWLAISLCFAELSGYPVQVLTSIPRPDPTLDLLRLGANQPQMMIEPDQSADISFSDVSRPDTTTNWTLHFNRHGQLTSASRSRMGQPAIIALKP
jgi:hypothetical protein